MTIAGGLTYLGLGILIAVGGYAIVISMAEHLANEFRRFLDIRGDWLGENSADDDAADDDAQWLSHGGTFESETIQLTSGNALSFTAPRQVRDDRRCSNG